MGSIRRGRITGQHETIRRIGGQHETNQSRHARRGCIMPEWLPPVLVLAGAILGFIGSIFGHQINAKKQKAEAKKQKAEMQLALFDQLQEERDRLDSKIDKLNTRITAFYADKHASRRYIASLERHIDQGLPPPPPAPPAGYVP